MMTVMDHVLAPIQAYIPLIKNVCIGFGLLIAGWVASKWVYRLALGALSLRRFDQALGRFLAAILRYLVLAATVIAAMESVGLHTTSLVAILASAGLAVGLALQGSLSNFASGVMILFFRPFHLGDKIGIADKVGVVEDIGLFTTILVSANNEKFIFPNTAVTGGVIVNYSDRGTLRGTLAVGVCGGAGDVDRITAVLVQAAQQAPGVAAEPPPSVHVIDMEAGGLSFGLAAWYKATEEQQVMHALRCSVLKALTAAGIKLGENPKMILQPRA